MIHIIPWEVSIVRKSKTGGQRVATDDFPVAACFGLCRLPALLQRVRNAPSQGDGACPSTAGDRHPAQLSLFWTCFYPSGRGWTQSSCQLRNVRCLRRFGNRCPGYPCSCDISDTPGVLAVCY